MNTCNYIFGKNSGRNFLPSTKLISAGYKPLATQLWLMLLSTECFEAEQLMIGSFSAIFQQPHTRGELGLKPSPLALKAIAQTTRPDIGNMGNRAAALLFRSVCSLCSMVCFMLLGINRLLKQEVKLRYEQVSRSHRLADNLILPDQQSNTFSWCWPLLWISGRLGATVAKLCPEKDDDTLKKIFMVRGTVWWKQAGWRCIRCTECEVVMALVRGIRSIEKI